MYTYFSKVYNIDSAQNFEKRVMAPDSLFVDCMYSNIIIISNGIL